MTEAVQLLICVFQLETATPYLRRGWPSGISTDSEDALRFCAFSGVRPMIETFPLTEAAAAYDRMMSGKARFRVVLVTEPRG